MSTTVEKSLATETNERNLEKERIYYPNNIGFPSPCPPNHYEFVMIGLQSDNVEALSSILRMFGEARARLVSFSFFKDQSPKQFVLDAIADLSQAKCSPQELLIRLNKLRKFVKIAEMGPSEKKMFNNFLFPLTFFGTVRALAMDSDRMVRLFKRMTDAFGDRAKEVIFEDGHEEGAEVIDALNGFIRDVAKDQKSQSQIKSLVLENAKSFLRAAGWGSLFFSKVGGSEMYRVTISDPPTDADGGMVSGNYFLHGMVAGIIEPFLEKEGIKVSMMKEGYDDDARILTMYYMERSLLDQISSEENFAKQGEKLEEHVESVQPVEPIEPKPQDDEVAKQVERVIKSLEKIQTLKRKRRPRTKKSKPQNKEQEQKPEETRIEEKREEQIQKVEEEKKEEGVVVVTSGGFGSGITITQEDEKAQDAPDAEELLDQQQEEYTDETI